MEDYLARCLAQTGAGEPGALLPFLKRQPDAWSIAHVPIHLEMFCFPSQGGDQAWFSTVTSLTLLYDRMVQPQRNIRNLCSIAKEKYPDLGTHATESHTWADIALQVLSYLAYQGMMAEGILLSEGALQGAIEKILAVV